MPPIACAPRRWHVCTSNSVYARMNGTAIVTADAVREHELGPVAELLDHREDVVPAARVEPDRVLAQLVEDLLHLEGGEDRLDQDGRPYAAARQPERILRRSAKTSFQSRASRWLSSFGR